MWFSLMVNFGESSGDSLCAVQREKNGFRQNVRRVSNDERHQRFDRQNNKTGTVHRQLHCRFQGNLRRFGRQQHSAGHYER